ncbi:MAG: hypothetical protein ACI4R9_06060 [Kiritimatiellia bacterium]
MILLWGIVLGVPLLAFGGVTFFSPRLSQSFTEAFRTSRACAAVLTCIAWLWTAYECATIGIDVFDALLLKEKSGGIFVWVLAVVLSYLTIIWMAKHLPVRALCGILMLIPSELFKVTRPLLPAHGFDSIQLLVAVVYLGAVVGMYGMFYPWRLEKGLDIVFRRNWRARVLGGICLGLGFTCLILGLIK